MLLNLVTSVTIITHHHDQQELQDEQICLLSLTTEFKKKFQSSCVLTEEIPHVPSSIEIYKVSVL